MLEKDNDLITINDMSNELINELNDAISDVVNKEMLSNLLLSMAIRKTKAPLSILIISGKPMTVRSIGKVLNELGYDVSNEYVRRSLDLACEKGFCIKFNVAMVYYYVPKMIRKIAMLYCMDTRDCPHVSSSLEKSTLERIIKCSKG